MIAKAISTNAESHLRFEIVLKQRLKAFFCFKLKAKRFKFLVPVVGMFMLTSAAMSDTLIVSIKETRNSDGVLRFNICQEDEYDVAVNERSACRLQHQAIASEEGVQTTLNVPQGQYAIMVLHDENNDGQSGFLGPLPTEGFGFSQNPSVILGAPSFNDVMVDVTGTVSITIEMRHFL